MGILDKIKEQALGAVGHLAAEHGPLAQQMLKLVQEGQGAGLSGLVQNFKDKGMGEIVESWVGTGKNLPVTAEQVKSALGQDRIKDLAAKAGVPPEEVAAKLSQFLPTLVDKLTPNGQLPDAAKSGKA